MRFRRSAGDSFEGSLSLCFCKLSLFVFVVDKESCFCSRTNVEKGFSKGLLENRTTSRRSPWCGRELSCLGDGMQVFAVGNGIDAKLYELQAKEIRY